MIFINQESELDLNGTAQVIYFYAPWMPHHKKMILMLSKMEEKYKDIIFYAVDVDAFKGLCVRFSVSSIPEVLLFKNNKKVKNITGIVLTSAFKKAFADIYNS
jgi:thioredoxin-like negative regulator of GroEL